MKRWRDFVPMFLAAGALVLPLSAVATPAFDRCFEVASRLHGVDARLLKAVAWVESRWNADARSDRNAHGLMQIRWPLTARHLGVSRVAELYNPCLNIELGARYLAELARRFEQDEVLFLAAYNYGPTRVEGGRIPPGVMAYVANVQAKAASLQREDQAAYPVTAERLELVRFASRTRAELFQRSLEASVPGLKVRVEDGGEAEEGSRLVVEPGTLTPFAARQLQRMFPEVMP